MIWMADSISILIKSDSANGCFINSSFVSPHQMRNWVKPIITTPVSVCDK